VFLGEGIMIELFGELDRVPAGLGISVTAV